MRNFIIHFGCFFILFNCFNIEAGFFWEKAPIASEPCNRVLSRIFYESYIPALCNMNIKVLLEDKHIDRQNLRIAIFHHVESMPNFRPWPDAVPPVHVCCRNRRRRLDKSVRWNDLWSLETE